MDEFIIKGGNNFLKLTIAEVFGFPKTTSPFGGYDTKCFIEIECGGFALKTHFWITTGEIFEFYTQLDVCNKQISGSANLHCYEHNLEVKLQYDINGHVTIKGSFSKQNQFDNLLNFHFESDQSYIQQTLVQLKAVTEKFGGMNGIRR